MNKSRCHHVIGSFTKYVYCMHVVFTYIISISLITQPEQNTTAGWMSSIFTSSIQMVKAFAFYIHPWTEQTTLLNAQYLEQTQFSDAYFRTYSCKCKVQNFIRDQKLSITSTHSGRRGDAQVVQRELMCHLEHSSFFLFLLYTFPSFFLFLLYISPSFSLFLLSLELASPGLCIL